MNIIDKSPNPPAPWRVIDGTPPNWGGYWAELCEYREVARMLIQRDLIVRFRQTFFGLAWLLFKPLMLMITMSFVFGFLSGFESKHSAPYPLIIFCGVIPWYFFSNAVPDSMNSLHGHIHILQKTYFPRAIIPLTAVVVNAIEFVIAWILFALGCIYFNYHPGWQALAFPLFCLQLLALCLGLGLWLSIINIKFRDVGNLVPFLLSIGFFVTPVGYTLSRIPEQWQLLYSLNPLVGIIEGIRWSLLNGMEEFPFRAVLISAGLTLTVAASAARYFLATESTLVDIA